MGFTSPTWLLRVIDVVLFGAIMALRGVASNHWERGLLAGLAFGVLGPVISLDCIQSFHVRRTSS